MQSKLRLLLLVTTFCSTLFGFAQSNMDMVPKKYIAFKTSDSIFIDGEDFDASWDKAKWSHTFIDIEGFKEPKYKTQVKMLWDETYFYILAKLEEPHVWATLKQRDTIIFYNNDFEVFIDPDGDAQNYYELEINALNTVWDLFLTKPYREASKVVLNDWTLTGLKSAVKVKGTLNNPSDTDQGWVLEMAIPWAAYKASYFHDNVPRDSFWRVNFSRVNWQHTIVNGVYKRKKDKNGKFLPEYNWVWSPMGVINMHEPEKWGYVYFSSKEVGADDIFNLPNDEKVKWELFKLYRAQKHYFSVKKQWATSLKDLTYTILEIDSAPIDPKLENHDFGWNISIKSPFSNKTLIINEQGQYFEK
jgi:hypothetical protein